MAAIMRNEFGSFLDRNGYAPSILQSDLTHCYLCYRADTKLDRHEAFGASNRQKSKRLGLWVMLCHSSCHEGRYGVHQDKDAASYMHRVAQEAAMKRYGWSTDDFIKEFGKSYL